MKRFLQDMDNNSMSMSMGGSSGSNGEEEDVHLSGAFLGHFVPACFFLGFGLYFLGLTWVRVSRGGGGRGRGVAGVAGVLGVRGNSNSNNDNNNIDEDDDNNNNALWITSSPPSSSSLLTSTLSIPESDSRILLGSGVTLMVCTTLGFLVEAIGGYLAKNNLWFQTAHETLYFLFFFAGACAFLESRGKLPPDASRCGVATALLGEYMLWYEHALMKTNMVDQRIHVILAQVSLANSAVLAWSIYQGAQSVIAYVLGFALLVLQGVWLMTAAFNLGINEVHSETGGFLNHHNVGVIFCVEVVALGFLLVFGTALVYSPSECDDNDKERSRPVTNTFNRNKTNEYERLSHATELPPDLDFT